MDEHARRVTQPFMDAWADFQEGRVSLLDLSRLAEHASAALDNASAPLPQMFAAAASDLEYAYHATESESHPAEGHRIVAPLLTILREEPDRA